MSGSTLDTIPAGIGTSRLLLRGVLPFGSDSGFIETEGDRDWFRVELRAGGHYEFRAAGIDGLDTTLSLRDATGRQLAFGDDHGRGTDGVIRFTAIADGTYYLDVGAEEVATGAYAVSASEVPAGTGSWASVGLSGVRTGDLAAEGDHDWHRIRLVAGETYHFLLRGASSGGGTLEDPFLVLRDATGAIVMTDDDGGVGKDSFIAFTPTLGGIYFLDAGAFGDGGTGSFSLTARNLARDDVPGGTETGIRIELRNLPSGDGSFAGAIGDAADADWFRVYLRAGETYRIAVTAMGEGDKALDATLEMRDILGNAITGAATGGSDAVLLFTATQTGRYLIDVGGAGASTGSYVLRVQETPAGPETWSNLAIGGSVSGRIDLVGDLDLHRVELEAGVTYAFSLRGKASRGGSLGDPILALFDEEGNSLGLDDEGGKGSDSLLLFTPRTSGTYYLQAAAYLDEAAGSYTLGAETAEGASAGDFGPDFDIVVNFTGDEVFRAAFEAAERRLEAIVTGDLPDVLASSRGAIDDLLIDVVIMPIDGVNNILAQAGAELMRDLANGALPFFGVMEFDIADLAILQQQGLLETTVLHEMVHVLGFEGYFFEGLGLLDEEGRYVGAAALAEYRQLSGDEDAAFIPLEDGGFPGTIGNHWEEAVFEDELMTGFMNEGVANPLSRLSIAALEDLGYQVDYALAEPYALPGGAAAAIA